MYWSAFLITTLSLTATIFNVESNVIDQMQHVRGVEGDSVQLPCLTTVPGRVFWRYQMNITDRTIHIYGHGRVYDDHIPRMEVNETTHALTIHNVTVNDIGLYTCLDNDGIGQAHYTELTVDVKNLTVATATEAPDDTSTGSSHDILIAVLVTVAVIAVAAIVVFIVVKHFKSKHDINTHHNEDNKEAVPLTTDTNIDHNEANNEKVPPKDNSIHHDEANNEKVPPKDINTHHNEVNNEKIPPKDINIHRDEADNEKVPQKDIFHPSTAQQEMCMVTVGVDEGDTVAILPEVYCVSLQRPNTVHKLPDIPTKMQLKSTACVGNNTLYVIGVGPDKRQTWKWNFNTGWEKLGDLVEGRRRHCATFVNDTVMYALGGLDRCGSMKSVEQLCTTTNTWTPVGLLAQAVHNAACVVHRTSVFVFGGCEKVAKDDIDLDYIQMYNTATYACTILTQRLPKPDRLLRAVMWDKSAILMNRYTCLVFDLEQHTFQKRNQFAPGLGHFGLAIEKENVFVIGGGTDDNIKSATRARNFSDVVKRVPVNDIIVNKTTVEWIEHAKLARSYLVSAYGCCSIDQSDLTSFPIC